MKMEVVRDPAKFDYYTPEDEARFAELIEKEGAISLFLYSKNVLTKDGIVHIDNDDESVRTIARRGVMYVPVSFFKRFLGKEVKSKDGFLPLIKTCSELGVFAKTYNDGLLAIVGGAEVDKEIASNPRLIYAGGYATLGKYDASKFTSEDFRSVKKKWTESIVGNEKINDISIPEIREKIGQIDERYLASKKVFHKDSDAIILFGEKPPTDSHDLNTQYNHLLNFAIAWGTFGSKYYRNSEVLDDILFGLEWMYTHMYGEAEIEERGWRSAHDYDWYHWFAGAPDMLTDILFIVEDHLTYEQKHNYLKCFWWVVSFMRQGYFQNCATSRIRVCTKSALILEDAEWMENEFYDYDLLTEINEEGEGPHIDFINWTHSYPYNFVYGNNNLCRVLFVGAILGGTPLEFTSPKQYNLYKLARYMFEPIIYRGRASQIFVGRCIGTEYAMGAATVAQLLPMLGLFGEDEDMAIKRIIKRNSYLPDFKASVISQCQLPELKKYLDILADPTVSYENDYEIGHAYFTGDRAVQQRNDYAFTVALCSDRHPSFESINGANKIAWYTGDGALYLSTNNDDTTFDAGNFFVNEKVMMNVPGTTVDAQKRIPWSHRVGLTGACDFVGSMASGAKYVTAAMDYHGYDFHGETVPDSDGEYGGGYLQHTSDLVAKKSYFLLDKECVCLGAGISSTTGYPVKTVVEDRRLVINDGDIVGTDRVTVDGAVLPVSDFEETVFDSPSFASLEGVGGYVFLEDMTVSAEKFTETEYYSYSNGARTGAYKHDDPKRFFKLCIEHGDMPECETYSYAVIPYATDKQLAQYAEHPEVEIISNTAECQAIRKNSIGFASYIFYRAGACEEIEVSEPCIVNVYESDGALDISVCDPTMKLEKIKVNVGRKLYLLEADTGVFVSTEECKSTILVNVTHSVGRPYTARFAL